MKKIYKNYFNLIELLIAAAIIGILISLLQPSLKKALLHAGRLECIQKEKEIGRLLELYNEDHNQLYPAYDDGNPSWASRLLPYLGVVGYNAYWGRNDTDFFTEKNSKMVYSGSKNAMMFPLSYQLNCFNPKWGSYTRKECGPGWSVNPTQGTHSVSVDDIENPSDTILVVDLKNTSSPMGYRWGGEITTAWDTQSAGSHNKAFHGEVDRNNYLMTDGHVEILFWYETIGSGEWVVGQSSMRGKWTISGSD